MRTSIFALLFICFAISSFGQKHGERMSLYDIEHYRFEIRLSDESDTIEGITTIDMTFKKDTEFFDLDLINEKNGKGMKVLAVLEGSRSLRFSHQNDIIKARVTVRKGDKKTYTIVYKGIPATGLVISKNKYGERTFFGDNWPDRGKHWLALFDHPADKATVEWIVTAPGHYQVVGNGKLVERTNINDKFSLTHWKTDVVLPTKVMVMGAARFAINYVEEVEGAEVSSWVYPQDREKGFYDYELAVPVLKWFINKVGPYPYAKLANVQSKTQFGGMENASNIFYSENSITGERTSEGLIAHEIAHQWFGNSASEASWHHVWLSEGFATYFTNLYMEEKYGRERLIEMLTAQRNQVIAYSKQNRVPVVNPQVENYMELLNANSYQKGGWVLHMLRRELGGLAFEVTMKEYYKRYKFSNALTGDLRKVAEEFSNKDLTQFFNQWIYQAGQPEINANWSYSNGELKIGFNQLQSENFQFTLDVDVKFEDGSSQRVNIPFNEKQFEWTQSLKKTPVEIVLDPDTWLLFEGQVTKN